MDDRPKVGPEYPEYHGRIGPILGRFGNHQIHRECHECIHQFIHVGTFILLLEFAGPGVWNKKYDSHKKLPQMVVQNGALTMVESVKNHLKQTKKSSTFHLNLGSMD